MAANDPYLFSQNAVSAVPYTYTVPGALQLAPTSISATFNGAAASGAFLPCVSIYAASGQLLARVFPPTGSVAAGDTAEVTYAPFVSAPVGASSGTSIRTTNGTINVNPTGILSIGAGLTLTQPVTGTAAIALTQQTAGLERVSGAGSAIAAGATAARVWAHVSGATLLSYTSTTAPTVINAGMYAVTVNPTCDTLITAGLEATALLSSSPLSPGANSASFPSNTGNALGVSRVSVTLINYMTAGQALALSVTNNDTIPHNFALSAGTVTRIY